MEKLHPAAIKLFTLQYFIGTAVLTAFLFFWLGMMVFVRTLSRFTSFKAVIAIPLVMFAVWLIVAFALSYIWAKMSYDRWHYEIKPEGFYVENGILRKKQTTIPYEKIQNVDIRRGILAQLFNVSDVQIQTAGYSGYTRAGWGAVASLNAEGLVPSLDPKVAESLKDELVKRARKSSGV